MKRLLIIVIIILFVFPVYTGCKKKAPVKPKAKKAAAAAPAVKPEPKVIEEITEEQESKYDYEPAGRRDPFVALVQKSPKKKEEKKEAALSPLEHFDASDFRLIAVASKGGAHTGLLLAPDEKAYTVTEGTVIGLNDGKIKDIDLSKLVIVEYIKDYKGELRPKEVILELRKGEVEE